LRNAKDCKHVLKDKIGKPLARKPIESAHPVSGRSLKQETRALAAHLHNSLVLHREAFSCLNELGKGNSC